MTKKNSRRIEFTPRKRTAVLRRYANPDLSVPEVAKREGMTAGELRRLLNSSMGRWLNLWFDEKGGPGYFPTFVYPDTPYGQELERQRKAAQR